MAYLPAAALRDSLYDAQWLLERTLLMARRHPSARHFGLARSSDTSDPAACAYIEDLARRVRRLGPSGSRAYYLTAFTEADTCASAVDFVLVDARELDEPLEPVRRWRRHQPLPVGVGAVGTWVDENAARGLRVPHSPEAQARYLERHLPDLLAAADSSSGGALADGPASGSAPLAAPNAQPADTASAAPPPTAVFVYRWRDDARAAADAVDRDARSRSYGLLAGQGARPALRVVRGLFTGEQTAFAFPQGTPPPPALPWTLFIGWGIVGALGVFYAGVAQFRRMAARYFQSPGFYREAVREGRTTIAGMSALLLVVAGLCAGLIATAALEAVQENKAFALLLRQLGPDLQAQVAGMLAHPWLLTLLAAAFYAGALLLWALLLSLFSRRAFSLQPDQALLLVLWPRWPMLLLMTAALVASTLASPLDRWVALAALAGALLVSIWATARTLLDFAALSRVSTANVAFLAFTTPLVILTVVILFVGLERSAEVAFLWHVLTRA